MNPSDRLNTLVSHFHTNVKAFAEMCGYDRPQVFYDIIKGKTKNVSSAMCERILKAFPSVSRVWLLTGEGQMIDDGSKRGPEEVEPAAQTVPLVHLSALAGPIAAYYEEGEDLAHCERIYSPVAGADLAIPISGDSMEPKFPNGSIAFISRINEASFIPWGHTLVLETENGVFIKNVLPDPSDKSYVWAESINEKYPPMHVPKTSIFRMYRVLSVVKFFQTL